MNKLVGDTRCVGTGLRCEETVEKKTSEHDLSNKTSADSFYFRLQELR